jgi:hypothetical protein
MIESCEDGSKLTGLSKETKRCGHFCYPSTTEKCCPCMDLRPMLEGHCYPIYQDGVGWVNTGTRDEGYCPICCPKNYDAWKQKIEEQKILKQCKVNADLVQQKETLRLETEDREKLKAVR